MWNRKLTTFDRIVIIFYEGLWRACAPQNEYRDWTGDSGSDWWTDGWIYLPDLHFWLYHTSGNVEPKTSVTQELKHSSVQPRKHHMRPFLFRIVNNKISSKMPCEKNVPALVQWDSLMWTVQIRRLESQFTKLQMSRTRKFHNHRPPHDTDRKSYKILTVTWQQEWN